MQRRTSVWLLGAGLMAGAALASDKPNGLPGENPNPIHLIRRPMAPLSAMAKLGRDIFFDASLSSSGKMSCASCHSPEHAYGPPNDGPVMLGGPLLTLPGVRAVPSLTYLERQPDFSIGPEKEDEDDNVNLARRAEAGKTAVRAEKSATQTAQSENIVPQGGLFWDGRADTLQNQASGPLFDPREMNGGSIEIVAEKLRNAEQKLHDWRVRCDPVCCRDVVAEISALNERLYEAVPTSALGAAELLERIAAALDDSSKLCAWRLRQIANRLGSGERLLEDFVFLRRLLPQFSRRLYGDEGFVVAPMLAAAIEGAVRPVLIYRAALPPVEKRWGGARA